MCNWINNWLYREEFAQIPFWTRVKITLAVFIIFVLLFILFVLPVKAEEDNLWKITAYCACPKCCGAYSDGITASGKKAKEGVVACNWLKFGTKVDIQGLGVFSVQDRGAKSLFGDKNNHIKHIDVFMDSHEKAKRFGVKWAVVKVL